MATAIFKDLCPNCYGNISSERLKEGLPCSRCLPDVSTNPCSYLENTGNLKGFSNFCFVSRESARFTEFFKEKLGFGPWALQETWARRVILGNSFAILAPTGVGKTTFGLAMASFIDGRSYIIVPTRILVKQAEEKLKKLTTKKVIAYSGNKKYRDEIASGNFEILVTTHMFLYKNFDLLKNHDFGFIFVDDVDSLLKASKNVDFIVRLLGFSERDIKRALFKPDLKIRKKPRGVLVISSATVQPRTKRVILFQNLLGFSVQKSSSTVRNVVDTKIDVKSPEEGLNRLSELVERLGDGGLVYVSTDLGKDWVEKVKDRLGALTYEDKEAFERFKKGEVKVLIGISHHQNPLVRGIDMPDRIRYAVFLGVPKILFQAKVDSPLPKNLIRFIYPLRIALPEERERLEEYADFLSRHFNVREDQLERFTGLGAKLKEIEEFIKEKITDPEVMRKIEGSDEISLLYREEGLYFVVGDATSYIQATGRTSRLFAGGLTKGLAVSLVYNQKARRSLERRLRSNFSFEFEFQDFERVDLEQILIEIDEDRERVRKILKGELQAERRDLVKSTLVVVESPNKARTIAHFFGRPQKRWAGESMAYEVNLGDRILVIVASLGHVLDLVEKGGIYGVVEDNGRFIPVYGTIKRCSATGEQTTENYCRSGRKPDQDKMGIIRSLRDLSMEVNEIFVATDPDSEGEKIAWDIFLNLLPFNKNIYRGEFHEVTPRAFREAIENPRDVNEDLVKAQILRRIADRWVGFSLSQKLQRYFGLKSLSAGRVQTPVLGWIIKREEERKKKVGLITVEVDGISISFKAENPEEIFKKIERADIQVVETEERELKPAPPLNTGEMLKVASDTLGFSASKTMSVAQDLFEKGLITYHRTDSIRVSDAGFKVAAEFIRENFGEMYLRLRRWGEGGAHECIRPTRPLPPEEVRFLVKEGKIELQDPGSAFKLYRVIWNRFIASQMKSVKVRTSTLKVAVDGKPLHEETVITRIIEDGFNLIEPVKVFRLPEKLEIKGKRLDYIPSAVPFTQGSLIEEMRKRGIGRPSTYAKIVQTLLDRRYVVEKKRYLFPTPLGIKVYRFLTTRYPVYTSEEFTRYLEEQMDKVEERKVSYQDILKDLKKVLHLE